MFLNSLEAHCAFEVLGLQQLLDGPGVYFEFCSDQVLRVGVLQDLDEDPGSACLQALVKILEHDGGQLGGEVKLGVFGFRVEFDQLLEDSVQVWVPYEDLLVVLLLYLSKHLIKSIRLLDLAELNPGSKNSAQERTFLCIHQVPEHILLEESLKRLGANIHQL